MKNDLLGLSTLVLKRTFYGFLSLIFTISTLMANDAADQDRTITGIITSTEDNQGLPGVNVIVKGTSTGTVTDVQGNYSLDVPGGGTALVFSSVGFTTQEITIGDQSVISLALVPDITALEEIVVVGYGTQQKVNLTGAVGVAKGEVLEDRPIANVAEGLQGVVPNLNITIRNGDPGAAPDFNIRGYESINGGEPLVLVDNVPMDINTVNPNDIESVSVLKDASAAAVYGARAAFGVILVTTKKGKPGKAKINFRTQFSAAKPIMNIDPITNPVEYMETQNAFNAFQDGLPAFEDRFIQAAQRWVDNPTTENAWYREGGELHFVGDNNYQEEMITDFAPVQQHDISVSGGSENASFYGSFGYFSKDGFLKPSKEKNEHFKRYNAVVKGDFKVTDWLSVGAKIMHSSTSDDKTHFYNWDVNVNTLARVGSTKAIQFPDLEYYFNPGDHDDYAQYIGMYYGGTNFFPYLLDGGRVTRKLNDTWLTGDVTLDLVEGLKIKSDFSYRLYSDNFQDVQSKVEVLGDLQSANPINNGFSGDDWINNQNDYRQYYVFNAFAEYQFTKSQDHNLTALVGFNQEWGENKWISALARSLITPAITDLNATVGNQTTEGSSAHVSLRGVFYRVAYNYKERYLLEANGRYDGTSRFPKEDRFGFFPSFSAGWRISNENFMAGASNWLDNLKIRASYGTLGNQTILRDARRDTYNGTNGERLQNFYPAISTMGIGVSNYIMSSGKIPYVSMAGLVSPTLTWETVITKNLGVDITLFNSRLDASFDIYTRDTKDMLMKVEYPPTLGTDAPDENAADLRTNGWELSLTWRDRIGDDWDYNVTLALADWGSEITKYDNPSGALSEYYVGQKLGDVWGYETVGFFESDAAVAELPDQSQLGSGWQAGDAQYADLNGDGVINSGSETLDDPGDRRIIGNETPRGTFGLNTGVGFKGFRLNVFMQGVANQDYWPGNNNWVRFFPFKAGHREKYFLPDSWSPENPDAYFARPRPGWNTNKNVHTQTRYMQNAGYLRLKVVTLSYDISRNWTNRMGLNVYVTGTNLAEITSLRKPLDAESLNRSITGDFDFNGAVEYPMQRIFTVGANLSF